MPDRQSSTRPLPPDASWVAFNGLTRRAAIAGTAFAAGFAAACQPVAASTIQTDASGIAESHQTTPGADGFAIPLFVAKPEGQGPFATIIVVHEIFGVHEWIKDVCRRLAKAGYMAVAPDLFARHGDATTISNFPELFAKIVAKTKDPEVLSDLDATTRWIDAHGGAPGRLGITGFCWGGRVVWLYAAHQPALSAGVAFYGRLKGDAPMQPIDLPAQLKAPVLGQYGGKDRGIPQSDVAQMNAALAAASDPSHITVYPQADHGFMADYRPSYNEAAAKQAWAAMLDWFETHIK